MCLLAALALQGGSVATSQTRLITIVIAWRRHDDQSDLCELAGTRSADY
jgi:hypothetical protein